MTKMSVEEIITNRIMDKLEEGIIPWKKPWFGMPGTGNVFTAKPYGLVNQILVSHEGGYMTEKQFTENNVKITAACPEIYKADKWEKGKPMYFPLKAEGYHLLTEEEWEAFTPIQKFNALSEPIINYWQKSYIKTDEKGEPIKDENGNPEIGHYPPSMRYVMVLWAGYTDHDYKMPETNNQTLDKPEALIDYYVNREGIKLNNVKGDRAFYRPSEDSITLPLFKQFRKSEEYYSTAFHEMTHSTGVSKRLNRDMKGWFGNPEYAKEELVAELGSAFLCNRFGIEKTINNSAAYIQSWLSALKNDKKLVFEAAKNATKAAEFITDGFVPPEDEPKEPKEEPKVEAPKALLSEVEKIIKNGVILSRFEDGTAFYCDSKEKAYGIICKDLGFKESKNQITQETLKRITPKVDVSVTAPDRRTFKEMKARLTEIRKKAGRKYKGVFILPNGAVVNLDYVERAVKALGNNAMIHYLDGDSNKFKSILVTGENGSAIICPITTTTAMQIEDTCFGFIA